MTSKLLPVLLPSYQKTIQVEKFKHIGTYTQWRIYKEAFSDLDPEAKKKCYLRTYRLKYNSIKVYLQDSKLKSKKTL